VKTKLKKLYLTLCILQLPACVWQIKPKSQFNSINNKTLDKSINIKVYGVECEFCAESVVQELSRFDGVLKVDLQNHNYYDNNSCDFQIVYSSNKILDYEYLKQEFSKILDDIGFKLESIKIDSDLIQN